MDIPMKINATSEDRDKIQRKIGFMMLEATFFGVLLVIALLDPPAPPVWMLPLFMLATIRMARTISFNEIGEGLRAPFTEVVPDSCHAGSNVHPKGAGLTYVIGSLMSCPICSGTWSALLLYATWVIWPAFGQTLVIVLALAGASEFLHWTMEVLEWTGRAARCISGLISPDDRRS